jgi:hypothetical protein
MLRCGITIAAEIQHLRIARHMPSIQGLGKGLFNGLNNLLLTGRSIM